MRLTDRLESIYIYNDREIHLRLYFDVVLRFFELMDDETFTERQKIVIAFNMLVDNTEELSDLSFNDKYKIVNGVLKRCLGSGSEETTGEKVYDFTLDADFIYASFFSEYGIDLIAEQGKLHWQKFKSLLNGLSEDSKFMKVIGYRTMEIPRATKHNQSEIKRLKKLKRMYALNSVKTIESIDRKMSDVFNALKKRAVRK